MTSRAIRDAHELIENVIRRTSFAVPRILDSLSSSIIKMSFVKRKESWFHSFFIKGAMRKRTKRNPMTNLWSVNPISRNTLRFVSIRIGRRNLNFGRQTCCAKTRFHLSIKRQASSILNGDRGALNMEVLGWASLVDKKLRVLESTVGLFAVVFN